MPEPIFTPSTKADIGGHDENISLEKLKDIVGVNRAQQIADISLKLYKKAADHALTRGIIIADTKFELGEIEGNLILIDEVLPPDSSRFWPVDQYQPGKSQPNLGKQGLRDYLSSLDWNKKAPAPALPADIIEKTIIRCREALTMITVGN